MLICSNCESNYDIIYPFDSSESVKYAVSQLKSYIFKISGALLCEYCDNRHEISTEIVIGFTNRGGYSEREKAELGEEGFIIRNIGDKIFILGSDVRGALYGVYTFLEEYLGCRFYTRDFEKVSKLDTIELEAFEDNKQIPTYFYRNSYWYPVSTPEISAKLKINGCHGRGVRFPDYLGGDVNYEGGFEHTIGWLAGQCPFGERAWSQPCLSDDKVFETVCNNVQWLLDKEPNAKLVSITQNDGDSGACKCDKCRAINDAEESEMGAMLSFVNRVAEHFEKDYPDLMFDTFAYRFTRKPPKTVRPRNNVIIRLCSIECCFRHPLSECEIAPAHTIKRSFKQDFLEWTKIAPNVTIWNYTTNFTNFQTFFCNLPTLLKNERFFAENGVKGSFEQGNFASPNGEFGELRGYLLARAQWNPYMCDEKFEEYLEEFISDYYGKGGKYILEYIRYAEECSKNSHFGIYYDNSNHYINADFDNPENGKLEFLNKGKELFDKAEACAENGLILAHIRASRVQLIDYEGFIYLSSESSPQNDERIRANHELRFRYMRRYGIRCNREFNYIEKVSEPDYMKHPLTWDAPANE